MVVVVEGRSRRRPEKGVFRWRELEARVGYMAAVASGDGKGSEVRWMT